MFSVPTVIRCLCKYHSLLLSVHCYKWEYTLFIVIIVVALMRWIPVWSGLRGYATTVWHHECWKKRRLQNYANSAAPQLRWKPPRRRWRWSLYCKMSHRPYPMVSHHANTHDARTHERARTHWNASCTTHTCPLYTYCMLNKIQIEHC